MNDISTLLGMRIRNLRKKRGWSQEELASRANLHTTYIGQVERGQKSVTVRNLERIVNALEYDISDIFRGVGNREDETSKKISEMITIFQSLNEKDQEFMLHLVTSVLAWRAE